VSYGVPPQAMQTYGLRNRRVPRSRLATCAEVACPAHVNGWRTVITGSDPQAAARIAYIRNDSGRRFTETPGPDGGIVYTFPAGQTCFSEHWTEINTLYVVRDWRGQAVGVPWRKHSGPDPWVDECATNQDALATEEARRG
jgi:hypothetical protein